MWWQPISAIVAAAPDVLLVELSTWIQNSDAHSAAAHMTAPADWLSLAPPHAFVSSLVRLGLLTQVQTISFAAPFVPCLLQPLLPSPVSHACDSAVLGIPSHPSSSRESTSTLHILGPLS